ncbi:NTP pyrophosphatase, house-cleaning of non-canonical NTPs [Salinibacillus kushneri]|uniref:NTP pyrophosphatase, house-cleaning of non-canonical NTPs n=1 Tax=Salinibacillus kushneri TaxID=237682 RepID=A0A1I0EXM4_9BACI|nr:nucleotide pyrophosphohydrolase [Salinibacillus kushneri]SET50387.1 NTP pyrophosphatase, house-cleaning of non-canonical NTPs [Salinibacillus kushneri]
MDKQDMTVRELVNAAIKFRDERDWKQFHNPKDLAISLSLEASELLENFQWKDSETSIKENQKNIHEELADVVIYSLMLSDMLDVDLNDIVLDKLEKNAKKYPVDKAKGNWKKYTDL